MTTLMMAAFHLGELVPGLWYCACSLAGLTHVDNNRTEPSLMLLVTPVLSQLCRVKPSAGKKICCLHGESWQQQVLVFNWWRFKIVIQKQLQCKNYSLLLWSAFSEQLVFLYRLSLKLTLGECFFKISSTISWLPWAGSTWVYTDSLLANQILFCVP